MNKATALPATIWRCSGHAVRMKGISTMQLVLLLCVLSWGQNSPSHGCSSATAAQAPKAPPTGQTSSSAPQCEEENRAAPEKKKGKKLRGEFVAAPLPVSSPALGSGIIPIVGYIFPLSRNDKTSPPSLVGGAGLITNNGSRAVAVAGQLFLKQDTYRITAVFLQGNLNYNLYGTGAVAGNAGLKLPLEQDGAVFGGEFLRRVKWNFFAGPRVLTGHSLITLRPGGSIKVAAPPDLGLRTTLTSLGFAIQRDTRPSRFYPTTGTVLEFTSDFFANSLGSKYSFQSYRTTFNKYGRLSKNQVLAFNIFFCATGGRPPFYGNCIYGARNELRGYEAGRYLDRYMIATQLEYRLALPKRFGLVGFGGIGGVGPGGLDSFRSRNFLPAGGAGVRFMLSKTYHVNLRADLAGGKNEHTFSMGVSEAF